MKAGACGLLVQDQRCAFALAVPGLTVRGTRYKNVEDAYQVVVFLLLSFKAVQQLPSGHNCVSEFTPLNVSECCLHSCLHHTRSPVSKGAMTCSNLAVRIEALRRCKPAEEQVLADASGAWQTMIEVH
eukprot:6483176-Amphidinium_carterae.1